MTPQSSGNYTVLNASHWGAYYAHVRLGRVVEARPFLERMPAPAADMIRAIPDWLYSETRVKYPMVRAGYLKKGPAADRSERGRGSFVRVGWDEALGLVARELERTKGEYGAESIYAGSYGGASVGKLHDAPALLKRMLALFGPVTSYTGDYSTGAAQIILPHVTGEIECDHIFGGSQVMALGFYLTLVPLGQTVRASGLLLGRAQNSVLRKPAREFSLPASP